MYLYICDYDKENRWLNRPVCDKWWRSKSRGHQKCSNCNRTVYDIITMGPISRNLKKKKTEIDKIIDKAGEGWQNCVLKKLNDCKALSDKYYCTYES